MNFVTASYEALVFLFACLPRHFRPPDKTRRSASSTRVRSTSSSASPVLNSCRKPSDKPDMSIPATALRATFAATTVTLRGGRGQEKVEFEFVRTQGAKLDLRQINSRTRNYQRATVAHAVTNRLPKQTKTITSPHLKNKCFVRTIGCIPPDSPSKWRTCSVGEVFLTQPRVLRRR